MICLEDVHKSFHRVEVLRGLSLRVEAGEMVGLIGPNGAGKSTGLRILTGQLLADSGMASIGGHDIAAAPLEARRNLGYVPQEGGVEPFLTGEEVLRFVAEIRGIPGDALIDHLLKDFGLSKARHRLTREYSEGMGRRLALAAAFLGDPPALVLDESLNGLDPRGARLVRDALEARRAGGAAILITGHVLETMERMCTRVALLDKGQIAVDLDQAAIRELSAQGKTLEDVFLEATSVES